jgi:Tetratricopeptide repeat
MNADKTKVILTLILSAFIGVYRCFLFPASAAAQATKTGEGLDALSDDQLMTELAQRNMTSLLDRAFEINHVPKDKQDGMRALLALRQLSDKKLAPAQRQQLAQDIARRIKGALPQMTDPKLLMQYAAELLPTIERDVNTLEYWGENPRTMANLQPVARTVIDLLERCAARAKEEAELAANRLGDNNNPQAAKRWEEMDNLQQTADYTKANSAYYYALSLDWSSPQRKQTASDALEYLKQFDVDDNPDRNFVRNRMAKLAMAAGDFEAARTIFSSVIADPKSSATLQYEARYFFAVSQLQSKNLNSAQKSLDDLLDWQKTNLAADTNVQDGVNAAASMLKFRILDAQSKASSDPVARKQATDAATAVLSELVKQQPALQGIIFEQLVTRLPDNTSLSDFDPLLLRAMVGKGEEIVLQGGAIGDDDKKILTRAVAASNEIISRGSKGDIDPQLAQNSMLLKGFFLQKLGSNVDAGSALLDFVQKFPTSDRAKLALDNAQVTIGQLMKDRREDEDVRKLYERFLPIAIAAPFNRTELSFEYAWRLQRQGKGADAAKYFRMVSDSDKRSLLAKYYLTISLSQELEELPKDSPQRPELLGEFTKTADVVNAGAADALKSAANDQDRGTARTMLLGTKLLAADLARTQQNDPQRALKLLEGFEDSVAGSPDEQQRLTDMLAIRVQSLMALQRFDEASDDLVKLLNRQPQRGAAMIYGLLENLNTQLERAEAANDAQQIGNIARSRAALTGFLVKMARESKNESLRKLSYGYAVFDAEVQRFAAVQETDAAARQQRLQRALELFQALQSSEGFEQFKASLAEGKPLPPYDPAVSLGLARVQFDLGNYLEARQHFTRLLNDKALGPAEKTVEDKGQERIIDNEQYWEAQFKLMQSNINSNTGVDETKNYLKQLYVRWGDKTGGKKWSAAISKLRDQIIPGFDPANPAAASSTTAAS